MFWPRIGGIEVLASNLLPALRERGHEFIVVTQQDTPDLPKETEFKGIPVYRFPFHRAFVERDITQLMEIRREVTKLKRTFMPTLVHTGADDFFLLMTTAADETALLVTLHGEWMHLDTKRPSLIERTLRAADWVVGCSGATLEKGRQLAPEITPRSSVIYNSLEVPPYAPEPLPTDAPRLLCVGRLTEEKGFDLALVAFASIVRRFPNARLVIVGDGPQRSALESQTHGLRITGHVEFTGWVVPDKIPALINAATLVVMPSRREGFPLVALQTGLMARPIVATRVGGVPEVVVQKETGLLVEKEDNHGLAKAISFLLEHPEAATLMGQAARRRAQEVFSWERCVDAYHTLYWKLVKKFSCAAAR